MTPFQKLKDRPEWQQFTPQEKLFLREHMTEQDPQPPRVASIIEQARRKLIPIHLPAPVLEVPFGDGAKRRNLLVECEAEDRVKISGKAFVRDRLRPVNLSLAKVDGHWAFAGPGERDGWHQEIEREFEDWASAHSNFLKLAACRKRGEALKVHS